MAEFEATAIVCTPTYALGLIDVALEWGLEDAFASVRSLICQGEPGASIPAARERIEAAWGARVFDHAGSTEVGVFSYPCAAGGGLHVNEREFLCEILDPTTGEEAAAGNPGGARADRARRAAAFPRSATAAATSSTSAGRARRAHEDVWLPNGIVGRTDDMVVIRGMNVFPSAIEQTLREVGVLGRVPDPLLHGGDRAGRDPRARRGDRPGARAHDRGAHLRAPRARACASCR